MLADLGLQTGDRVAVLAPNTHVMLESHYGVLYAGMVLVALNTRLSADELRYIVGHADCWVIVADARAAEPRDALTRRWARHRGSPSWSPGTGTTLRGRPHVRRRTV